eukprot:Rhum_TRINITY_DN12566_c0_g1::Rhum_TRINITY_DN12566_c0_g1_i1::g.52953::m.52953
MEHSRPANLVDEKLVGRDVVRVHLPLHEDQNLAVAGVLSDEAGNGGRPVRQPALHGLVRDVLPSLVVGLTDQVDHDLVRHELLDQAVHPVWEGCREEQRLPRLVSHGLHNPLNVLGEPHVKHTVSLVQNKRVALCQVHVSPLKVVHQPARRANHNVDTPLQLLRLVSDRLAAVERRSRHRARGHAAHLIAHLLGELACGEDNEHAGLARLRWWHAKELFDAGKREGQGLTRTRAGTAHHVPPCEAGREGGSLNGEERLDAATIQSGLRLVAQRKGRDRHILEVGGVQLLVVAVVVRDVGGVPVPAGLAERRSASGGEGKGGARGNLPGRSHGAAAQDLSTDGPHHRVGATV